MKRTSQRAAIRPPRFVLVALGVLATACGDGEGPASPHDNEAGAALASIQVRQSIALLNEAQPPRTFSYSSRQPTAVFPHLPAQRGRSVRDRPGVTIRHFRDKNGIRHSIGLYHEGRGEPPKNIFVFTEGRIQAVVSSQYLRRGSGYERRAARLTFFDTSGTPVRQVELRPDQHDSLHTVSNRSDRLRSILSDALLVALPRPLHAEEIPGACLSEWISYGAASLALAAANTALTASLAGCPTTGTTCLTIEVAVVAWAAALAKWNEALDKLAVCIEKNRNSSGDDAEMTGDGNLGGGGGGGGSMEDFTADRQDLEDMVDDFISLSIAAGNYWCNDSGDYCVYYGMT